MHRAGHSANLRIQRSVDRGLGLADHASASGELARVKVDPGVCDICVRLRKHSGLGPAAFDIGHWLRLRFMDPKDTPAKTPRAIVLIHALAYLGIALWLAIFLMAALGNLPGNKWLIMALAIGLGVLHFAISRLTAKRSRAAIALTWVLLVADLGLMFFVTWRAAILVIASVILVILEIRTLKPTANTPH